jgi:hypothetical protein
MPLLETTKRLVSLFLLTRKADADGSFGGEYAVLDRLADKLEIDAGFVVDIAASDGYSQSSTLGFFRRKNWSGLAVEMDPHKFSKLAFFYADFPNAKLLRQRVTPLNIRSLLRSCEVPKDLAILNLDIDSYDLYVMEEMLRADYRPKIISMEINEKIPPPIYFTVLYEESHYWQGDHFFGCSIAAASGVVKPFGYILQSLAYNNAIFIRSDIGKSRFSDLRAEDAYNEGYRNQPDRKTLFPWNADVECLLEYAPDDAVRFINDLFRKYKGKYTLRESL